jgi:hypothetical protein
MGMSGMIVPGEVAPPILIISGRKTRDVLATGRQPDDTNGGFYDSRRSGFL